jgi:very-short-patch-repair endonuclease
MNELERARAHIVVSTHATSHRCAARRDAGEIVRVHRNVYVHSSYLADAADRWDAARRATAARTCAVAMALGPGAVVVGQAAAAAHGIEAASDLVDVHVCVRSPSHRSREELPALPFPGGRIRGGVVPPVRLVRHETALEDSWTAWVAPGVRASDLPTTGAMCAQLLAPRDGTVAVSGILQAMSDFTRFADRISASRIREGQARHQIADRLDRIPSRRGRRRARAVISAADGACESVPERVLLWILKAAGFTGVLTQVHHRVGGRDYYVDFEIPPYRVVVESDSDGKHQKHGETAADVHGSYDKQMRRQKALESIGLAFVRFKPNEYNDPPLVIEEIARRCGLRTPPRAVPSLLR